MSTAPPDPGPPSRLQQHFTGHEPAIHGQKWEELYREGFTPWDRGGPNPALTDLLTERKDLFGDVFVSDPVLGKRRKKALIPGCGRGYEVLLFSAFGYDAYGLEISESALVSAKKTQELLEEDEMYKARDTGAGKGLVSWLAGDFFKDEALEGLEGGGRFDLLYDYTFLAALPPSLRPAWSLRCRELLTPAGHLICVEFPTYKAHNYGGPPWALPPKVYMGHLTRPGEELEYDDEIGLLEDRLGPESEVGLERIEHFQPKRTHAAGIGADGKISDWISVWRCKVVA